MSDPSHLDHIWAGWRMAYVEGDDPHSGHSCVFCHISELGIQKETLVLDSTDLTFVVMNLFPYTSGHILILPKRHICGLDDLSVEESIELWEKVRVGAMAVENAFSPGGKNVGINLGRAAGAGIAEHLHVHIVPRWGADSNFMTSVADARVLPEAITDSWEKLARVWGQ